MSRYIFKGYTIEHRPNQGPGGDWNWQYVHDDYNGPGDDRHGWARSAEEAESLIDEAEEDRNDHPRQ